MSSHASLGVKYTILDRMNNSLWTRIAYLWRQMRPNLKIDRWCVNFMSHTTKLLEIQLSTRELRAFILRTKMSTHTMLQCRDYGCSTKDSSITHTLYSRKSFREIITNPITLYKPTDSEILSPFARRKIHNIGI